jgi:hypothetical protein
MLPDLNPDPSAVVGVQLPYAGDGQRRQRFRRQPFYICSGPGPVAPAHSQPGLRMDTDDLPGRRADDWPSKRTARRFEEELGQPRAAKRPRVPGVRAPG